MSRLVLMVLCWRLRRLDLETKASTAAWPPTLQATALPQLYWTSNVSFTTQCFPKDTAGITAPLKESDSTDKMIELLVLVPSATTFQSNGFMFPLFSQRICINVCINVSVRCMWPLFQILLQCGWHQQDPCGLGSVIRCQSSVAPQEGHAQSWHGDGKAPACSWLPGIQMTSTSYR